MRHRIYGKQLNRKSEHRIAMLRNMVTSLIKHERIRTTTPKAKTLRPYAERLITYAKKGVLEFSAEVMKRSVSATIHSPRRRLWSSLGSG